MPNNTDTWSVSPPSLTPVRSPPLLRLPMSGSSCLVLAALVLSYWPETWDMAVPPHEAAQPSHWTTSPRPVEVHTKTDIYHNANKHLNLFHTGREAKLYTYTPPSMFNTPPSHISLPSHTHILGAKDKHGERNTDTLL